MLVHVGANSWTTNLQGEVRSLKRPTFRASPCRLGESEPALINLIMLVKQYKPDTFYYPYLIIFVYVHICSWFKKHPSTYGKSRGAGRRSCDPSSGLVRPNWRVPLIRLRLKHWCNLRGKIMECHRGTPMEPPEFSMGNTGGGPSGLSAQVSGSLDRWTEPMPELCHLQSAAMGRYEIRHHLRSPE